MSSSPPTTDQHDESHASGSLDESHGNGRTSSCRGNHADQAEPLRHHLPEARRDYVCSHGADGHDIAHVNSAGKVLASAWCEAVVERVPDYFDAADQPYVRQADLKSASNKTFGRKFDIVSFR